jgi:predicted ester cyclase
MSTIEENKNFIKSLFEEVSNQHNLDAVEKFWSTDFTNHNAFPGQPAGSMGVKLSLEHLFSVFPDYKEEIIDLVAENNKVVAYVNLSGTHSKDFMGIATTNRFVKFKVMEIFSIENNKIQEMWVLADFSSLHQQLTA